MNLVSLSKADLLVQGGLVLTCVGREGDLIGRITGGAIASAGERILAVGRQAEIAAQVDVSGSRVGICDDRRWNFRMVAGRRRA